MVIIFAQVRAICVQIAYHSKLEVSSLSVDFKNAHRSPAKNQLIPCVSKGFTHRDQFVFLRSVQQLVRS